MRRSGAPGASAPNGKLADYFRVPSLRHYLVLDSGRRTALRYLRQGDQIALTLLREGVITLDPPSFSIAITDLFS